MPYSNLHPTAALLCKTVEQMLSEKKPDLITAEEVLEKSGISKGSLYHHFEDLSDLIETTLIIRYAHWIDLSIRSMSKLLETGKTTKSLKEGLFKVTYATQSDPDRHGLGKRQLRGFFSNSSNFFKSNLRIKASQRRKSKK